MYTQTHTHAHAHARTRTGTHTSTTHAYAHTHTHIHTYMHSLTHTHTHTSHLTELPKMKVKARSVAENVEKPCTKRRQKKGSFWCCVTFYASFSHAYTHTCTRIHTHTCTRIYIHTHTHTHTHTSWCMAVIIVAWKRNIYNLMSNAIVRQYGEGLWCKLLIKINSL